MAKSNSIYQPPTDEREMTDSQPRDKPDSLTGTDSRYIREKGYTRLYQNHMIAMELENIINYKYKTEIFDETFMYYRKWFRFAPWDIIVL